MKNTPVRQTPEKHKIDKLKSLVLNTFFSSYVFFFVDSLINHKCTSSTSSMRFLFKNKFKETEEKILILIKHENKIQYEMHF